MPIRKKSTYEQITSKTSKLEKKKTNIKAILVAVILGISILIVLWYFCVRKWKKAKPVIPEIEKFIDSETKKEVSVSDVNAGLYELIHVSPKSEAM